MTITQTEIINVVHLGEIGKVFRARCLDRRGNARDVSAVDGAINMFAEDPQGNVSTWVGSFTTDGTDALIEYVSVANDLDEVGWWTGHFELNGPSTAVIYTEKFEFEVLGVLAP